MPDKQFIPYLFVENMPSRPTFVTAVALLGAGMLYLDVPPDIGRLREREQIAVVAEIIKNHYFDTGGHIPLFSNSIIISYLYINKPNDGIRIGTDGVPLERVSGFHRPRTYIMVGKETVETTDAPMLTLDKTAD